MNKYLRWLFPTGCLAFALYVLRLSYRAYARWHEYVVLGDFSGAEAYEVEFWPEVSLAVALILLSGFLAGRWSVARPA